MNESPITSEINDRISSAQEATKLSVHPMEKYRFPSIYKNPDRPQIKKNKKFETPFGSVLFKDKSIPGQIKEIHGAIKKTYELLDSSLINPKSEAYVERQDELVDDKEENTKWRKDTTKSLSKILKSLTKIEKGMGGVLSGNRGLLDGISSAIGASLSGLGGLIGGALSNPMLWKTIGMTAGPILAAGIGWNIGNWLAQNVVLPGLDKGMEETTKLQGMASTQRPVKLETETGESVPLYVNNGKVTKEKIHKEEQGITETGTPNIVEVENVPLNTSHGVPESVKTIEEAQSSYDEGQTEYGKLRNELLEFHNKTSYQINSLKINKRLFESKLSQAATPKDALKIGEEYTKFATIHSQMIDNIEQKTDQLLQKIKGSSLTSEQKDSLIENNPYLKDRNAGWLKDIWDFIRSPLASNLQQDVIDKEGALPQDTTKTEKELNKDIQIQKNKEIERTEKRWMPRAEAKPKTIPASKERVSEPILTQAYVMTRTPTQDKLATVNVTNNNNMVASGSSGKNAQISTSLDTENMGSDIRQIRRELGMVQLG
jgi:hypothetical protein